MKEIIGMNPPDTRMDHTASLVKNPSHLNDQIKTIEIYTNKDKNDAHWQYYVHFIDGKRIDHQQFSNLSEAEQKKENKSLGNYWRFIS